jgi:hypothetical protein
MKEIFAAFSALILFFTAGHTSDSNSANNEERNNSDTAAETICEYDGQSGYEEGDIVLSFDSCQPLTCKNGIFTGNDANFCDGCRYWNNPGKEGKIGEKMKYTCNDSIERDWCECVKSDSPAGKKWACHYSNACQCMHDGKRYDLGYERADNTCETSVCAGGSFIGMDMDYCESCRFYYNRSKEAKIGEKQNFICSDGSEVEWCECVGESGRTDRKHWKCTDRADLSCPAK